MLIQEILLYVIELALRIQQNWFYLKDSLDSTGK